MKKIIVALLILAALGAGCYGLAQINWSGTPGGGHVVVVPVVVKAPPVEYDPVVDR